MVLVSKEKSVERCEGVEEIRADGRRVYDAGAGWCWSADGACPQDFVLPLRARAR